MTTRQQRRQFERQKKKRGKTIVQAFTYVDAEGLERSLNTDAMRMWAEANLDLTKVDIDLKKIEDMIKHGRIDKDYVMTGSLRSEPKPILICNDFEDGRAEIVDGNHTYVAMAVAAAMAPKLGIGLPDNPRAPAFVLDREFWTRFFL
ncbi:hypothetical protein [Sulfitobacter mediterraneus]|uniref:hypothetical protein n=1 Tax=Sulfitobacter mediterraneus TaxID=83219 RepID=UPI000EA2DC29|nr:hypothetical protein [Sulfitobacter mediterraneus]